MPHGVSRSDGGHRAACPVGETGVIKKEDDMTHTDFDAAVALMDDELRERIHLETAPCTEEEFLAAYGAAHQAQFGEAFAPLSGEAW